MSPTVFLIVLLFLTITGRDNIFWFPHFFSVFFLRGLGVILFDNPKVMVGQRDLMRSSIRRFPSGDLVYVKARAIFWAPCPIGSNRSWQEAKTILPFFLTLFVCFFFTTIIVGFFSIGPLWIFTKSIDISSTIQKRFCIIALISSHYRCSSAIFFFFSSFFRPPSFVNCRFLYMEDDDRKSNKIKGGRKGRKIYIIYSKDVDYKKK